jgi:hypothetical protein
MHQLITLENAGHGWAGLGNANPVFRWALDSINQYLYPLLPCAQSPLALKPQATEPVTLFPNPCAAGQTLFVGNGTKSVKIATVQGVSLGHYRVQKGQITLPELSSGVYTIWAETNKQTIIQTLMVSKP